MHAITSFTSSRSAASHRPATAGAATARAALCAVAAIGAAAALGGLVAGGLAGAPLFAQETPHQHGAPAPGAGAATPATPRPADVPPGAGTRGAKGEMVGYEAAGETVQAYLTKPATGVVWPGVVLIHEWWGMNDQIKGMAERFADMGYVAVVPDLYRGQVAGDPGLAHELMRGLNEDRAVEIIKGGITYLRTLENATNRPVATIGFCMGGRLSLAAGLKAPDFPTAVVMFYGSVETTPEAVAPLKAPLLGLFGAEDRGIPVEDVRKLEAALKKAGKTATIVVYPGVGHAFMNENNPGYKKDIAEKAWAQVKAFLARHLHSNRHLKSMTTAPATAPRPASGGGASAAGGRS